MEFGDKDSENNICGGMNMCENRKYDESKDDCQQCVDDADARCPNCKGTLTDNKREFRMECICGFEQYY